MIAIVEDMEVFHFPENNQRRLEYYPISVEQRAHFLQLERDYELWERTIYLTQEIHLSRREMDSEITKRAEIA